MKAIARTLETVGTLMEAATHPWWIIGSAAAALHGLTPVEVADIDILLDEEDARAIFARLGLPLVAGAEHPHFRSTLFGRWHDVPKPVEFMAGFDVWSVDEWRPVRPATRVIFRRGAVSLFAPERLELAAITRALGRPKDIDRADRLAMMA